MWNLVLATLLYWVGVPKHSFNKLLKEQFNKVFMKTRLKKYISTLHGQDFVGTSHLPTSLFGQCLI
jgi:hypothetical protein